jgi:hypothetical protein
VRACERYAKEREVLIDGSCAGARVRHYCLPSARIVILLTSCGLALTQVGMSKKRILW